VRENLESFLAYARDNYTFLGDLIAGTAWVHLPITVGYDRFPELLIEEKQKLLDRVIAERGWAFFAHDAKYSASRITRDEAGKCAATEKLEKLAWS
jgi:hypothetical protein